MSGPLQEALFRLGGALLAPGGRRAKLSILIFHSVVPDPDPWRSGSLTLREFDDVLRWLAGNFRVLPLEEAVARLDDDSLPARSVAITFDDGYRDNVEIALPALRNRGLAATFFIATGMLDGGMMWNDKLVEAFRQTRRDALGDANVGFEEVALGSEAERIAACKRTIRRLKHLPAERRNEAVARLVAQAGAVLDTRLMMDSAQVVELGAAGMSVGAHTVSHPILAKLDDAQAEAEIRQSKERLSDLLGKEVTLFAYPNGKPGEDYTRAHVDIVKRCGFRLAVSTSPGVSTRSSDRYQLPRFTPWDKDSLRFGLRLLGNARRPATVV